jgi:hypothetical protein
MYAIKAKWIPETAEKSKNESDSFTGNAKQGKTNPIKKRIEQEQA